MSYKKNITNWHYHGELDLVDEDNFSVAGLLQRTERASKIERKLGHQIMAEFRGGKELRELSRIFQVPAAVILSHLRNQGVGYLSSVAERLYSKGKSINQIKQLTGIATEVIFSKLSAEQQDQITSSVLVSFHGGETVRSIIIRLDIPRKLCYDILEEAGLDVVTILERKINEYFKAPVPAN
jgi:hypothetical protein